MRERIRGIERLYHIEASIGHVKDFLEGKTFEEMKDDKMCFHAVVYNIMIIGEAANMLTKNSRMSIQKHLGAVLSICVMCSCMVITWQVRCLFGRPTPTTLVRCLNK